MAKVKTPQAPPAPAAPKRPIGGGSYLAKRLAEVTRNAYGPNAAHTLDEFSLGEPRGWVPTRNLAIDRAIGGPGLPLGRIIEIAGMEGSGKSTFCDQVIASCQAEGGLAVLGDTEASRTIDHMQALGCDPEQIVGLTVRTIEGLFAQAELIVKNVAHLNALAWYEALKADGVKIPKLKTQTFEVFDTVSTGGARPVEKISMVKWGREQAAALIEWQKAHGLPVTGIRDARSRAELKPVVMPTEDPKTRSALYQEHHNGVEVEGVELADRPVTFVWDSVGGTPSHSELEGTPFDTVPAAAARVLKKNLRRLTQLINDEAVLFLMANQKYELIGQQSFRGRTPSTSYGGSGIRFHSSIRIDLSRGKAIPFPGSGDDWRAPRMGQEVHAQIIKNRMGAPDRRGSYGLIYGRGCDNAWALYQSLKDQGFISAGGAWSKFTDPERFGHDGAWQGGWMGLSNLLAEDATLFAKLKTVYLEAPNV